MLQDILDDCVQFLQASKVNCELLNNEVQTQSCFISAFSMCANTTVLMTYFCFPLSQMKQQRIINGVSGRTHPPDNTPLATIHSIYSRLFETR